MRILVFLPCLTLGGAERQGLLVARYLRDRGHDVEVWGFPSPGGRATLLQELRHHGLRYEELPSWPALSWKWSDSPLVWRIVRYWKWSRRLRKLAADLPARTFDVIIPFTFWPSLVACLMREALGASRCFWNHRGGDDNAGVPYTSFLTKEVLQHHPRFLANSSAGARFLQKAFSLSQAEVTVVPNAYRPEVDVGKESAASARLPSNELSLIQVANFYPEKDYDTLLRGLRILKANRTACRLHFCGEFLSDSDRSRFLDRVRDLGLQDDVVDHGPTTREDVFRLLLDSDIGLLSSKSEGQPNSVMEYMYTGLPVVGTRIPGIQELVGPENEAWLFEPGDAEGLARLVVRLEGDPVLRTEIGRRNRRRIIEGFAPERVLPQWGRLVEDDMTCQSAMTSNQ